MLQNAVLRLGKLLKCRQNTGLLQIKGYKKKAGLKSTPGNTRDVLFKRFG